VCHALAVTTGRFAPTPSGPLHLGNLRTAVAAWLFARSAGSPVLLRIEDLDAASAREEHVTGQQRDLATLGLEWDGEVVRQSQRFDRYREALARLTDADLTYRCYCTRREVAEAARAPHGDLPEGAYPGTCRELSEVARRTHEREGRSPALRLRVPEGTRHTFDDRLAGRREATVDDFVVCRRDGTPSYNLAVVVDDADQGVGEVVRGDDLIPTTPRQIHVAHLLGLPRVTYAHVPLVVGVDGERLAKRHGAITLAHRLERGETPATVTAALVASLGCRIGGPTGEGGSGSGGGMRWGGDGRVVPGRGERPLQILAEAARAFDPSAIPRTPWTWDPDKNVF
jgi:glutamyl-tRNA synthetase